MEFLILDWMGAELIAQKRGGPYYAPNPLGGGPPKGARGGWKVGNSHLWADDIVVRWGNER